MIDLLPGFTDETAGAKPTVPAPRSFGILDVDGYAATVELPGDNPDLRRCVETSRAIIHATHDHAAPDAHHLISCSWGKDSTAMVMLCVDVMLRRQKAGQRIVPTLLLVAHTGNEFPGMAARIQEENRLLNAFAAARGLPLRCQVVSPPARDQLMTQLVGAGRPLPRFASGASAKAGPSSWCVHRLKIQPQDRGLREATAGMAGVIHFLGTRHAESSSRSAKMSRYADGLPWGLSRLTVSRGAGRVEDHKRIGVTPIAHWSGGVLTAYLKTSLAPWNLDSLENLREIYAAGTSAEAREEAGECGIHIAEDGGVTSVCQDLGGVRFGCVTCVCSSNRSLINHARNDRRYVWLNRLHKWIIRANDIHRGRIKDLRAAGFDETTLFPKSMLFSWRYFTLMMAYRAEMESGFSLLEPGVADAIKAQWERSGVYLVTPEMARRDAARWKATGRIEFEWTAARYVVDVNDTLSGGVPPGIYAAARNPEHVKRGIEPVNLLAMVGVGQPLLPVHKAYIFQDLSPRGGYLAMVTDLPSDLGRATNTSALNGYNALSLRFVGMRDLTPGERFLGRDRTIFYRYTPEALVAGVGALSGIKDWTPGTPLLEAGKPRTGKLSKLGGARLLADIFYATTDLPGGCELDRVLSDHWTESSLAIESAPRTNAVRLARLYAHVGRMAAISDLLSEKVEDAYRKFQREHRGDLGRLNSAQHGATPEDLAFQREQVTALRDTFAAAALGDLFEAYLRHARVLIRMLALGYGNAALVNRMATITRHSWYDPSYAAEALVELTGGLARRMAA